LTIYCCYFVLARDFALKEMDVVQPYKVRYVLLALSHITAHDWLL